MKTFLAPNEFISGSASVPLAKSEAAAACPQPRAAANLSDGVGAKPILAFMPSEAATVSGTAPVAADQNQEAAGKHPFPSVRANSEPEQQRKTLGVTAGRDQHPTLSHNKITQAVEISLRTPRAKPRQQGASKEDRGVDPTLRGVTVLIGSSPALPVSSEPSLPAVSNSPAQEIAGPFENDLERLIGVAGKRSRRRLALPKFVPDEDAIEAAMHDETAPRLREGDPVWADDPPSFLQIAG